MRNRRFASPLLSITALAALALTMPGCASAQEPALDDARIAHVAVTANAIDIEMGELAAGRSTDERVLAFAQTMITDHTAVNGQAAALAGRLGLTPVDNEISQSLQADGAAVVARLTDLSGAEFDRAYMAREVAYHEAVLEAVDGTLIPNTTNAELRTLLEQARAAIAAHLEHARELRSALGGDA